MEYRKSSAAAHNRLRKVFDRLGLNQRAVTALYGKKGGYMNERLSRHVRFDEQFAYWFAERYRLDPEWLLTGEGPPPPWLSERTGESEPDYLVSAGPAAHLVFVNNLNHFKHLEGAERYHAIPYMADAAGAGSPRVMEEEIAGYVVIQQRIAPSPEHLRAVQIHGDSMADTLPHGSIVAVDITCKDPHSLRGKIVCSHTPPDLGVVIKRLALEGQRLRLLSDNTDQNTHPLIEVNLTLNPNPIIGQVVWAWQDLR